MKTVPFYPNHFGLYNVYNGANKRYMHAPYDRMDPDSDLCSSRMGNAVGSLEESVSKLTHRLNNQPRKARKQARKTA